MGNSWIIRLYKADDYSKEIDIIGDFKQYHDRQEDDVVVFSGMYGIGDYFIWYMHKNIQAYDFSTVNIDLSLYLDGDSKKTFWRRQYKILDIKYDANESKYVLFGISLDSAKLQTKLVDYNIISPSWKRNRPPEEVLWDILVVNGIFKVEYMESAYEKDLRNFEYRMFTFDENWTVEDFINYIADQNHFEWYVRNDTLYIGKECKAIAGMNSTRKFDLEKDNISNTAWFKKYSGETRPMDIMSHIGKVWRCVWVKHMAGSRGGISKGCFTRRGIGTLDKENYLKTLEGQPERNLASKLFINKPYSHYITLGNIIKDEGNPIYVDQVSVQKNKQLYKVNEPSDIKIDRDLNTPLKQIKHRVVRSTPYLDANAGIFFPSPWLEEEVEEGEGEDKKFIKGNPPNALIFQVKGKEESSVIGPFVMGNSEENFKKDKIPVKNAKDFRFSLPNGWTMYVDKDGRTMMQTSNRKTSQSGAFSNDDAKATTYMYMTPPHPVGGRTRGAAFSFNATDGEHGDVIEEAGGCTVRFTENQGVSIYTKAKKGGPWTGYEGVNALFEKTKILHTVLEDVTDLDWDPTKKNKTRYDQENTYIKLEHENGNFIDFVYIAENDILLRVGVDGDEKYIRLVDSEIDLVIGDSSISLLDNEVIIDSSANLTFTVGSNEIGISTSAVTITGGGVTATLSGGVMDVT